MMSNRQARSPAVEDAQLLTRVVEQQDVTALETLILRHSGLVMAVARQHLQRQEDAEEVFQSTFLKLTEKGGTIRDRQAIACWLLKVARNESRQLLRSKQRNKVRSQSEILEQTVTIAETDENQHDVELLLDELHQLPKNYQSAVILCHLEGKTQEEAAELLGLSPGAVKGRLERGRKLLKQRLVKRGIGMSILLTAWQAHQATAASYVTTSLVQQTITTCMSSVLLTAGSTAATTSLSKGTMLMAATGGKKVVGVSVLLLCLLGGGAGLLFSLKDNDDSISPSMPRPAVPLKVSRQPPLGDEVPRDMPSLIERIGELEQWYEEELFTNIEYTKKYEKKSYKRELVSETARQDSVLIQNDQVSSPLTDDRLAKHWKGSWHYIWQDGKLKETRIDNVVGAYTDTFVTRYNGMRHIEIQLTDPRFRTMIVKDELIAPHQYEYFYTDPYRTVFAMNVTFGGQLSRMLQGGDDYQHQHYAPGNTVRVESEYLEQTEREGEPVILVRLRGYLNEVIAAEYMLELAIRKYYIPQRVIYWRQQEDGTLDKYMDWKVTRWEELAPDVWFPMEAESKKRTTGNDEKYEYYSRYSVKNEFISFKPNYPDDFFIYKENGE